MSTTVDSSFEKEQIPSFRVHTDSGPETHLVAMDGSGYLTSLVVTNPTANDRYVQVHDDDALPANGAIPLVSFEVVAGSTVSMDGIPIFVETGVVIAVSDTVDDLTISTDEFMILANVRR